MSRGNQIELVPDTVDLELYAGDGVKLRLVVSDEAGQRVPLNGVVTAQIRRHRADSAIEATWAIDMVNAQDGVVFISLTGPDTQSLVNGKDFSGFWDVQWVATGKQPVTVMQGKVHCGLDVTRP